MLSRSLLSMALFWSGTAAATTCAFQDFSRAVRQADAVALVEVKRYLPETVNGHTFTQDMQVAVLHTYLGKLAPTIVIRGDNGMAPFPYVTAYPVGTRWVIPLSHRDWWNQEPLPRNLYTPVSCSGMGLLVSGPVAYGVLLQQGQTGLAEPIALNKLPEWVAAYRRKK